MIEATGGWAQGYAWIEDVEFDNRWTGSGGNAGSRGVLSRGYVGVGSGCSFRLLYRFGISARHIADIKQKNRHF